MGNHLRGRTPKKTAGFSWGRVVTDGAVAYRLFRRDQRGALHWFLRTFEGTDRAAMADELKRARRLLRDQVDEVDLKFMGVTQ